LSASADFATRSARYDAFCAAARDVIESDQRIEGEYPAFGARGNGAYITDVDGNRYLDFILAYGTIILGHAHPAVDEAVIAEIRHGFALSMPLPVQSALTKRLTEVIPDAEMAMLLKTGSDATGAAVRLCRAFTGRDVVIRWGYNGWHEWCAMRRTGIPAAVESTVDSFRYNDLESLADTLSRHRGKVACIIMMPFETELPAPGFLAGVRELADQHGALLVFDEIRSGFRLGLGGAQSHYGVRADLVTVGKALSNGYALSAVVGRRDVLSRLSQVHISSTFFANSLDMAAGLATIDILSTTPALPRIADLGRRLQDGLTQIVVATGLPARVVGAPQMPFLRFPDQDVRAQLAKRVFYTGTVRRGILFHPNHHWYICAATTEQDIDMALAASREAAAEAVQGAAVRAAVDSAPVRNF
jgi:glutamate-1-semialdehyde 2,1-aminomutase